MRWKRGTMRSAVCVEGVLKSEFWMQKMQRLSSELEDRGEIGGERWKVRDRECEGGGRGKKSYASSAG